MGLIRSLRDGFSRAFNGVKASGSFWDAMDHPSWGGMVGSRKTISGENISPASALKHSAYFACINRRSTDLAVLPGCVVEGTPDGPKQRLWDHPVTHLINGTEFNPETTGLTGRQTLTMWMDGWGDGPAEIQRNGKGEPVAIWQLHPNRIYIDRDKTKAGHPLRYRIRTPDESSRVDVADLDMSEVFHVHGLGDGLRGFSKMRLADETLGLGIGAQSFAAAFFGNGLNPSMQFTPLANMKPEDALKLLELLTKGMTGSGRKAFNILVSNAAGKFERLSFNPAESQVLETRAFSVEDVCRFFDMHPEIIGHSTKAQGWQSFEGRYRIYQTDCLRPLARMWETEIDRKLLPKGKNLHFRFDFRDLMRADHKTRSEYNEKKIQCGAMRPEEWREDDDDPASGDPNAKKLWVKSGMQTLESAAKGPQPGLPHALPPEEDDAPAPARGNASAAVLDAAASRVASKECKAFERAAGKFAALSQGYLAWSATFYETLTSDLLAQFKPSFEGAPWLAAWAKATGTAIGQMASSEQARGTHLRGEDRERRTRATILSTLAEHLR